ncbi:hypothetical protein ACFPH6_12230 [Streptomyces xiangluensis]|uniref:ABM domain-containing protein n=1 Tax=Streptomyces xiangluensis TaxID=2665720 RepID=A0ABV8YJ19_9ACTN
MSGYADEVPGYLTFRVTPQEGPIAAFAEQEAWQARERYPQLLGRPGRGSRRVARCRSDVPSGS